MSVTLSPPAIATAIPAIPALLGYRPQDGQLTVLHLTAHDPASWRVVGCHATQPGAPDDELPTVLSFMDAEADRLGFQLQGRLAVAWSDAPPSPELIAAAAARDYTVVQARHDPDESVQWRYPGIAADQWRATDSSSPLMAELVHAGVNTHPTATWKDRFIDQWAPKGAWSQAVADAAAAATYPSTPDQVESVQQAVIAADQMWALITGPDRAAAGAAAITACTGPLWMRDLTMMRAAKDWRAAEGPFAAAVSAANDGQVAPVASTAAFAAAHHGEVGLATRLSTLAADNNAHHSLTQLMNRWVTKSSDPSIIRFLVAGMTSDEIVQHALPEAATQEPPAAAPQPKPGRGL